MTDVEPSRGRGHWTTWGFPTMTGLGSAAVYALLSLARYDRVDERSWDLAIFSQAARSYSESGHPVSDVKGPGFDLLGDHFSPVVALFGPLWAVAGSPASLLVAQAVLLGVSVAVVLAAAVRHLGSAAGAAVGLAYALSFGLAEAADFDVHEVAFAVPLLALAGAAYLRRDWWAVCRWTVPLLLVKEDQGLTLVAVGVVLLLAGARRLGIGLAALGVVATALVLTVLIPAANPDGGYAYWAKLGGGGSTGADLLSLPLDAVWPVVKIETLLLTFGITGFLALRSPWALVAVPTLAWRFASDEPFYWGTDWHYSLTVMPIVFVALVDGVVRAREGRSRWLARYADHGPAVALAVAIALLPQYALADLVRQQTWADTARERAAERVVDRIPDGASVAGDITLLARLVPDHDVYFVGTDTGPDAVVPDWVVVDTRLGWQPGELATYAEQTWPGSGWHDVPLVGDFQLARRG